MKSLWPAALLFTTFFIHETPLRVPRVVSMDDLGGFKRVFLRSGLRTSTTLLNKGKMIPPWMATTRQHEILKK